MKRSNGYGSVIGSGEYRTSATLGVLLMVAVTVALVAVVGMYSFGLASGNADAPSVTLSTEIDLQSNRVVLVHRGGQPLQPDQTRFLISNESDGRQITVSAGNGTEPLKTGDRISIRTTDPSATGWHVDDGSETFELRRGITYAIEVIDDETQTVIYRTSLTMA